MLTVQHVRLPHIEICTVHTLYYQSFVEIDVTLGPVTPRSICVTRYRGVAFRCIISEPDTASELPFKLENRSVDCVNLSNAENKHIGLDASPAIYKGHIYVVHVYILGET